MSESQRIRAPRPKQERKPDAAKEPVPTRPVQRAPVPAWATGPVSAPFALGGVRRKVAVGDAHDPPEREAEQVASRVGNGGTVEPEHISRLSAGRPEERKPAHPAGPKQEERPDTPVRKASKPKEPEKKDGKSPPAAQKAARPDERREDKSKAVQKAEAHGREEKKPDDARIQRLVTEQDDVEPVHAARKGSDRDPTPSMEAAAARAIDTRGAGEPLHPDTRSTLESGMGVDLGDVRVHHDGGAHEAAAALNARAFTHQSDIWLGAGESAHDVSLMAHEATHVVQQTGSVQRRLVQRVPAQPAAPASGPQTPKQAEERLKVFPLPPIKSRHRHLYEAWAHAKKLARAPGYDRGEPDQKDSVWIPTVKVPQRDLDRLHVKPAQPGSSTIEMGRPPRRRTLPNSEWGRLLSVPDWDRTGARLRDPLEVDHIVELQVAGWTGGSEGVANNIENMELLDKSSNASSGSQTRSNVRRKVREYLQALGQPSDKGAIDKYLAENRLEFTQVEFGEGRAEAGSQWWTRAEIEAGRHLVEGRPGPEPGLAGSPTSFALLSPAGGLVVAEYAHPAAQSTIALTSEVDQRRVSGLRITAIRLDADYPTAEPGRAIGTLDYSWDLPDTVRAPSTRMQLSIVKARIGKYTGEIRGPLPRLESDVPGASPLAFDEVSFDGNVISARGRLSPTIPLLAKVPIEARLLGRNVEFAYVYRPDDLTLPVPGLTIDDASLEIFFGTRGLGVGGSVDVTVAGAGSGSLAARIDTQRNFEASGSFRFDTRLFDRATIAIWYRNRAFGGSGTLEINKPNKIRGIRAATVTATFEEHAFHATGTVQPAIPGIRQAALDVGYSEAEGLTIGGSLQLAENVPGIESGSLDVKLQKPPGEERWKVKGHGTAAPKIPGVTSTVTLDYDDGAFDVSGTAAYERGMLKGSLTIGATNRPLDPDGRPSGPPPDEGGQLRAYGGGTVTIRIAPWLQGTIGVRLLPNGEVEVAGQIGLPGVLDVFPEKRLDKNLLTIGLDIPIVGVSVVGQRIGIFANISGGLDLSAGIGPGQLQELQLGVTYNPAHEDQTHVTGGAHLHIPAHAGVRLFVRGGLGAGIPIVSAQAGLEVGGGIGIEGAVEAGVEIDWTPTRGLKLDALGEIHAEPKLKFDVTGFVTVDADLLFSTINLYEQRWQLAAFEYGSNLRFGVKFPIHYEEGRPFDVSLSDVQFEVPQIDPGDVLRNLIKKIA